MPGPDHHDELHMQVAYEEAEAGYREGGVPVGAVMVKDGRVVARGRNRRVQDGNPVSPERVERLPSASLRGVIDHVIVNQGCRVEQLNHDGDGHAVRVRPTDEPLREEEEHRSQPFTPMRFEIVKDGPNHRNVGLELRQQRFFEPLELLVHGT